MNSDTLNKKSWVRRIVPRPSLPLMVSLLALVIASSTAGYAAVVLPPHSVGTKHLKDNAVVSRKVKDKALYAKDVAPGQFVRPASKAWRTLSIAPGYKRYDATLYPPSQYRKDETGRVWLRGLVTKTTGLPAGGDRIATLPAGYRPKYEQLFAVASGEPAHAAVVRLDQVGGLFWTIPPTAEPDFIDLNSISYMTK